MENDPNTLQLHKNPFRNTLYTHSSDYKAIVADFRIFTILGVFCRIAGGRGHLIYRLLIGPYQVLQFQVTEIGRFQVAEFES